MQTIEATVSCPIYDSFRVQQIAGMFDVELSAKATESFRVEIPELNDPWKIGLIVGPSGSGKSTIARHAFGEKLYEHPAWPQDRAVVDCFGQLPTKQITGLFTAVGFSSPPSWVKPYHVLSRGEQFRCDLARALAGSMNQTAGNQTAGGPGDQKSIHLEKSVSSASGLFEPGPLEPLVVFDEFTSVVDRTVARIGSAAISRAIRSGNIPCRFVAVTCHYDVTEWLAPDWIADMASGTCDWRCLRRPSISLEIFRCRYTAWRMFARHHYLSNSLSKMARCFVALYDGVPVAFCATLPIIGRRGHWRISRIVTLPDYQGVGIGMNVAEAVAQIHRDQGHRLNVTASHPSLIGHCRRSPLWRAVSIRKTGSAKTERFIHNYHGSAGRAVVSFEYLGEKKR